MVGNLAAQNDNLDQVITQTRSVVSDFDARRPELVDSIGIDGTGGPPAVDHLRRGGPVS